MLRARRRSIWLIVAVLGMAATGFAWWYSGRGRPYHAPPLTFDGTSDQLRQTVVVPTLDSPFPDGKSAIWCASFQLAWNRLKEGVAKGSIRLANGQPVADRLNRGDQTEADLEPASVFSAAGLARDGVADRIRAEMARKFPNGPAPQLEVPADGAIAYAYLEAAARFDIPFFDNNEPFEFTDAAGKKTTVGSFGIRKQDEYAYPSLRAQVRILYRRQEQDRRGPDVPEFIVDPCQTSQPYQIVLALVDRKPTLAETVADVQSKIARQPAPPHESMVHPIDTLLVPNMAWQVTHHFTDLEGTDKRFLNPGLEGLYLGTAMQTIRFRLDRSGAELRSESKDYVKPAANYFHLNRPFLVLMNKRESNRPFFVMWVDNAELLQTK